MLWGRAHGYLESLASAGLGRILQSAGGAAAPCPVHSVVAGSKEMHTSHPDQYLPYRVDRSRAYRYHPGTQPVNKSVDIHKKVVCINVVFSSRAPV